MDTRGQRNWAERDDRGRAFGQRSDDRPRGLDNSSLSAAEHAKAVARDAARSGKSAAAEEIGSIAGGIRRSAAGWDGERHAWVRDRLASAADGLDRFSWTLRDRDVGELFPEIEAFARRNPAVFTAGCALAGFAITRFLRSGPRRG